MDFITQLPRTRLGHDALLVVVDKYSKMIHCIPTTTTVTAPQTAQLFIDNVVRLHGCPTSIISDRDTRFTSQFWQELWSRLGTKLAMSTAYHPQTDGQTERANRTIEEMLRAYVNKRQNDWDCHLTAVEIAYNNSRQASTGYSPFFLNTGQHPQLPLSLAASARLERSSSNASAEQLLEQLWEDLEIAQQSVAKAQAAQERNANRHRSERAFAVGNRVLLSTQDLRWSGRVTPKLTQRFIGPFVVKRVLSPLVYELELPPTLPVHPVFHVSKLQPYHADVDPARQQEPPRPPPELVDDNEEYEVEEVLNKRLTRRGRGPPLVQYLVRWKGYEDWECTWEAADNLENSRDLVMEYERRQQE